MTPEIKQRIEQIRRGKVPKGYKRTKAGIMPLDWCSEKEYKAKNIFKSVTNKKHNGKFQVLSATQDKGVIPRSQVDIDIKFDESNVTGYKKVDCGDFVISLRSFQGGIEYSEYEGLVSPAYTVLKPIVPICDGYYKAYFKTVDYISRLNKGTYGIRDGKQVGFEDFGDMILHYPSLAEQEKIAEVLSVQDKLIALKEKLIEEKMKQKKHLMQRLLHGNGWEKRKLSELAEIDTGGADTQDKKENGAYPFFVRSATIEKIDSYTYNGEAILIPGDGKIGEIFHYYVGKFNYHQRVYKISSFRDCIGKFIYYYLQLFFKKRAYTMTAKATVDSLRMEMLSDMPISLPNLKQQQKITAILSAADSEIQLLQTELEQEKQKKKALMQLLLTGIVRVSVCAN